MSVCGNDFDQADAGLRYMIEEANLYLPFLLELKGQHKIPKTRSTLVEEFSRSGDTLLAARATTTKSFVTEYMRCQNRQSTKIVITGGHEMTKPLYQLAMDGLRPQAASLLVMDYHLDFYTSGNPTLDSTPHKGNFLGHMLTAKDYPNPVLW
jgi:hypothetical protein